MAMTSQEQRTFVLQIDGMDCSTCANTIASYLQKKGCRNVSVDYAGGMAQFNAGDDTDLDTIRKGISDLGYQVVGQTDSGKQSTINPLIIKLVTSICLTLPLMLHMISNVALLHDVHFQLACSIPVMCIGWYHFGRTAWNALRLGVLHMDLLIIIGSTAAFVYSMIGVFYLKQSDYLFFETSASIITLVLLGNYLEHRAVEQTRRALKQLQHIKPEKAWRINFYGLGKFEQLEEVPVSQLLTSDIILIRNGDAIAVDGLVIDGEADVNESLITGESIPVHKQKGHEVLAGTTILNGSLNVQVKKLGDHTTLSSIIRLMKTMKARDVSIQRLADRITAVFVPVVLCIALMSFVINYIVADAGITESMMRSIAVLVISCPCAMGLATPTALMVGIGFAARKGILFKDASVIERIPKVRNVVFDKTGTLTSGAFRINKLSCTHYSEQQCRSWIYTIEKHSSHPIAKSLIQELQSAETADLIGITEIAGRGMQAGDNQGNTFLLTGFYDEQQGLYGVELFVNEQSVCRVQLSDEVNTGATQLVAELHHLGITTTILSGDRIQRVKLLAAETGITQYYAEHKPEDKVARIDELKKQGTVMMVGDGINDAPALAAADIGVSLAAQSGITTDAATVVLLRNKIESLADAISISRLTYTTIKQNLFWAFFYNVLAIPLAAAGYLSPMIGAAAMACSDLIVIGNSLLLRYKRLR